MTTSESASPSGLTYAASGVDTAAGDRAVDLMKEAVAATHGPEVLARVVMQEREIRDVRFCTLEEVDELAADFTSRRVRAAVAGDQPYTESGR